MKKFFISKNNIGVFLGILGTFLIVYAIGQLPSQGEFIGVGTSIAGRFVSYAYVLHPGWLKAGIVLIFISYIFQLKSEK